jgi:hypothetical protein
LKRQIGRGESRGFFVRDGIAQYIDGAVAGLEKNSGRLTDKTDDRVWFGIFVVSKIAQR